MRVLFLAALLATACPPLPTPNPPDVVDGGPLDAARPDPCQAACDRMAELRCPGAEGSATATCAEVCHNTETSGVARFCPDEVARINSCSELNAAFVACE